MRKALRFATSPALLLAVVALAIAWGGVALASSSGSGVINACAAKKSGSLRLLAKGKCKKSEKSVHWSVTGPRGAAGTNGTNGANGAVAGFQKSKVGVVDISGGTQLNPTTVTTLSLPAGSFIVNAKTEISDQSTAAVSGNSTCVLSDGSAVDSSQTNTDAEFSHGILGFFNSTMMPLEMAVTSASPSTVTLGCYGAISTSGSGSGPDASESMITAVQTSSNSIQ